MHWHLQCIGIQKTPFAQNHQETSAQWRITCLEQFVRAVDRVCDACATRARLFVYDMCVHVCVSERVFGVVFVYVCACVGVRACFSVRLCVRVCGCVRACVSLYVWGRVCIIVCRMHKPITTQKKLAIY